MELSEVREQIDKIDPILKGLLMMRLDCSYQVAEAKAKAGETKIYRADREEAILERLSEGVPKDRVAGYLSVVRKVMETSRMYQYGLLYQWNPQVFEPLLAGRTIPEKCKYVVISVERMDRLNAMSSILSMIGDYGYNMEKMELMEENEEKKTVRFHLTIRGNLNEASMKNLMFQLSEECLSFEILEISA